jgi:hypothetical protein
MYSILVEINMCVCYTGTYIYQQPLIKYQKLSIKTINKINKFIHVFTFREQVSGKTKKFYEKKLFPKVFAKSFVIFRWHFLR